MKTNTKTVVECADWQVTFAGGHNVEVKDLRPGGKLLLLPCPSGSFGHGDVEMFARGWVWAKQYG